MRYHNKSKELALANYFDDSSATSVIDQMKECLTLWYSIDNGASVNTNIPLPAAVNGQQNVRIAFKYISGSYHGQWQIMNLTISEQ